MKKWNLALIILIGSSLFGCANTEKVQGSSLVPAASGKVVADRASGGATELKIEMEHLAKPTSVGANHYIVWVRPEGSSAYQNIGALRVDDDLDGRLEKIIPYEEFQVLVTPERDLAAVSPSGPTVFEQKMDR